MPALTSPATERAALACAWCGTPFDDDSRRLRGRTVCSRCGVATTDPWPGAAELARAYEGWYRPASGRFSGPGDRVLRRLRGRLAARVDRLAPPGPVLDVGAGDGALLDALAERGRPAYGLERTATRPDVRGAKVADLDPGERRYAAIVLWHALEHLAAPGAAIDRSAELLLPGGLIVVAIPNAASLQARTFGDRWLALDLPRHLTHIPADALVARLRAVGLQIERESHWRGGQVLFGWLHGLVGALPGHPDLYDAIRRPAARSRRLGGRRRVATLLAGVAVAPAAIVLVAAEVLGRRGGTVLVEARRS